MIIQREWIVSCSCPDCGEPMPALVRIAEQYFPAREKPDAPAQTFLSPSMMMGAGHLHCDRCGVTHNPSRLEPALTRVDLGPREV